MLSILRTQYRPLFCAVMVLGMLWWVTDHPLGARRAVAQTEEAGPSSGNTVPTGGNEPAPTPAAPLADPDKSMNLLKLTIDGGIFMIPIFGLSIFAATIIVERFIGLRRAKILPDEIVTELGQLSMAKTGFDPRAAYRICQQYPSVAARVIRTMLLKVGRPLSEVESAVKDTSDREATKMFGNVRWLLMSANTATLLGLIGTVQGMILAFHQLTIADPKANKAQLLASGIYVALVTTFAGLCVAIPAGVFAQYFESRIQALFHDIDDLVTSVLPQVERYEGRVRFSRSEDDAPAVANNTPAPAAAAVKS